MWTDAVAGGINVRVTISVWGWVGLGYYFALAMLNLVVLLQLFVVSPQHRRPAGLMLVGHVASRYTFLHEVFSLDYPLPLPPDAVAIAIPFSFYAVALLGFHVFDPVPAARKAALAQMVEGMLVVDAEGDIVDANPTAQKILGHSAAELRGRAVGELLPLADSERESSDDVGANRFEITLGGESGPHFLVSRSQLKDRGGRSLGQLLMLHDVTEQKDTQARLLEHQEMVAALREREHLARELHDGVGQVLGM